MKLNLQNKNALVCGSTSGIGKASALALASEGITVTLVARNEEKLKTVLNQLAVKNGQQHDYIKANFSEPHRLKQKISKATENKTYHILLNNTGGPPAGNIVEANTEEFEKAIQQHLICNHLLMQAVVPGMKKEGYGRIINIISTSVKQPLDGLGVSNTIRAAVGNWSKTLANELGEFAITVNNILPGATATDRLEDIIKEKADKNGISQKEAAEQIKANIPAKRFGKPSELADAVVFLAGETGSYINGINLPVDGGRTKSL